MNKTLSNTFITLALLVGAMLFTLAASPALAAGKTGTRAFPVQERSFAVDTLEWSDQAAYSHVDTVTGTVKDTTTSTIDVTGCTRVSLWTLLRSVTTSGYQAVRLRPQISPDGSTWISFASSFTVKKATTGSDTMVAILYDKDYAIDTLAATDSTTNMRFPVGRDFRLLKGGRFMRFVSFPAGPDSATVTTVLRREWE